jgi:hypothetical protein
VYVSFSTTSGTTVSLGDRGLDRSLRTFGSAPASARVGLAITVLSVIAAGAAVQDTYRIGDYGV